MKITGVFSRSTNRSELYWAVLALVMALWGITACVSKSFAVKIFAPFFLLFLLILVIGSFRVFRQSAALSLFNKIFLYGQITFWGLLLVLTYPGLFSYDAFVTVNIAGTGDLSAWQTYMFSILASAVSYIDPSLIGLPFLQVLIYLFLLARVTAYRPLRSWIAVCVFSVLAVMPLMQLTLTFLTRDVLFGLLTCLLLIELYPLISKKRALTLVDIIRLCVLLFVLAGLRQDGKIYFLAFPLIIYFSGLKFRRPLIVGAIFTAVFASSLHWIWSKNETSNYFQAYELTAIYKPLNYIVYKRPESFSDNEKVVLNRVVPFELMTQRYDDHYIFLFHEGKYTLPVSASDWSEFKMLYLKTVTRNMDLFLYERTWLMMATLNLAPGSYISSNSFDEDSAFFNNIKNKYNLTRLKWATPFRLQYEDLLKFGFTGQSNNKTTNAIVFALVVLIGLLVTACIWVGAINLKSKQILVAGTLAGLMSFLLLRFFGYPLVFNWLLVSPISSMALAAYVAYQHPQLRAFYFLGFSFILSRFPLVFLLAPENHMTYLSPLIYFPLLFTILASKKSSTVSKT